MGFGVLGLGSGAASSLNQETIDKIKEKDKIATVKPWEDKLENMDKEYEVMGEIYTLVQNLETAAKDLALSYSHSNVFESVSASTSGSGSAVFNADDVSGLSPGNTEVFVEQLAKTEISYSQTFSKTDKDSAIITTDATFKITMNKDIDKDGDIDGDDSFELDLKDKTYQELADEINLSEHFIASIEQVSDTEYRLVIKGSATGDESKMKFTSTGLADTNPIYAADADFDNELDSGDDNEGFRQLQDAKNFIGTVDGMEYNRSSNTITLQGNLTMTAIAKDEVGKSTLLTLERDSSLIIPSLQNLATAYNELQSKISNELINVDENGDSKESSIYDKSTIRTLLSSVKEKMFGEYNGTDETSLFDLGFNVDKSGDLSINTSEVAKAIKNDFQGFKEFFLGTKGSDGIIDTDDDQSGLGTALFEITDNFDSFDGLLYNNSISMQDRKDDWKDELAKAQKILDERYAQMATQFAQYGAVINQMEAAFGGMKMMMDQSTAKQ